MSSKAAKSDLVIKKAPRDIDVRRYAAFVSELTRKIIETGHRVGQSVNRELVLLYWNIGRGILTARSARAGAQGHRTASLRPNSARPSLM